MSVSVRRARLRSLDTCRGLLLLVDVAAISLLAPQPDQPRHTTWLTEPHRRRIYLRA